MSDKPSWHRLVPMIDSVAANVLVSASTFAALIQMLAGKGLLTDEEVREVYETALRLLEENQGSDPDTDAIYEAAREVIEAQLR